MFIRRLSLLLLIAATLASGGGAAEPAMPPLQDRAAFRRPVAAAWLVPGKSLITANRRSGTVSLVDVIQGRIVAEFAVGERLADLAALPEPRHYVAVDDKAHELIVFCIDADENLQITGHTAVSRYPAGIAVMSDGARALVTGLWSNALDVVALKPTGVMNEPVSPDAKSPRVVDSFQLSFPAREVAVWPGIEKLALVYDGFGGRMAIVNLDARTIERTGDTHFHNIRGLTVDGARRELWFVYQLSSSSSFASGTYGGGDGGPISNRLGRISPDRPANIPLDQLFGAGDPSAVAITSRDQVLIALAGNQSLALMTDDKIERSYVVGARPVAVLPTPDGLRACVVNQLDDSISVVDLQNGAARTISLGPEPELFPRDRGERLFFDARLSAGGFLSCHSCHSEGHSNGRLVDTLADGTRDTPKRVLTLMGTALTDQWAWNGSFRELREQVRQSFVSTMHARPLKPEDHDDVVAFLHTLPFPPAPDPQPREDADRDLLERGRAVFKSFSCANCHVAPLTYTTQGAFDVGLRDEQGQAKFNPPSLRGVGQNAAFFHDNRAESLDDVFRGFAHQLPDDAGEADVDALIRFLRSL